MMTQSKKWFVTFGSNGPCDPNGFFCYDCYIKEVDEQHVWISRSKQVDPENTPYHRCDLCNRDYRD